MDKKEVAEIEPAIAKDRPLVPEWILDLFDSPSTIVRGLYLIAIVSMALSVFISIYVALSLDSDSTVNNIHLPLIPILYGLLISGMSMGLSTYIRSVNGEYIPWINRLTKIQYSIAGCIFIIGTTITTLNVVALNSEYFDNAYKVQLFISIFNQDSVFFVAIVLALAGMLSRREGSFGRNWRTDVALYLFAIVSFSLGCAYSALLVFSGNRNPDDTSLDQVVTFFMMLLNMGVFNAAVIAGLGGMVGISKQVGARHCCDICEHDLLDNWIVCPYCGSNCNQNRSNENL